MANPLINLLEYQPRTQLPAYIDITPKVDISIVIPVYNEEDNILPLYEGLKQVLSALETTYEIIFIDDGSIDKTFARLQALHSQDERVWVIRFRRNFGQTAAFSAGFDIAQGDVIITMDGDLQNDPIDIPLLLEKINEGYDVVSGWRKKRNDTYLTRKLPSRIANYVISGVTKIKLHDYGCSLKAYRSEVLKSVRLYGDLHRFIPALTSWVGINVAEVPVNHHPRRSGKSKYGLLRTIKVILDLITVKFLLDYATRPMQVFGLLGAISFSAGVLLSSYLTALKIFFGENLSDRPILLLGILLIVLGVQLITMGLLGEMIARTYHETQRKTIYTIREILEPKWDLNQPRTE